MASSNTATAARSAKSSPGRSSAAANGCTAGSTAARTPAAAGASRASPTCAAEPQPTDCATTRESSGGAATAASQATGDDVVLTVNLPWPPSALSPNARHGHWGQLARAKAQYRRACAFVALAQGARSLKGSCERLSVHLTFVPPNRHHRDDDNLIAAMKSGLDGLADVLGVDDSKWHVTHDPVSVAEIGGFVRVAVARWPVDGKEALAE